MSVMDLKTIVVLLMVSILARATEIDISEQTLCAYSKQSSVKIAASLSSENSHSSDDDSSKRSFFVTLTDDNSTQICGRGTVFCYALWTEDTTDNVTNTEVLSQGCWGTSNEAGCDESECLSRKKPKAMNNTKFCCCRGNHCNLNFTDAYVPEEDITEPTPLSVEQASYKTEAVVIVLASVLSLAIISIAGFFIFRLWSSRSKPNPESLMHLMESPPPNSNSYPTLDLDTLKLQEFVGRGRFGSVSKGTLMDHTVAVKIFVAQNRNYFLSERDIYTLSFMDHPYLPKYIGSQERLNTDGFPEYLLVLSYASNGCLQDYLRQNTIDWNHLCKMAQSITNALAHLHTEIRRGDKSKPCIAHRDLNSRNILVKADLSCEVCDFGFAIRISGSKYYQHGEEQVAETTSLADVGTLRYMAPEVLEGAVNLRDCETSLKQIDIYALGLVMWEIATRCSDLYQGMETPQYKLPFESEIGLHPSMEQMQVLVTRNKARPLFPDIWKATNPAVRQLKETIDDCWDQDAEARLTALCVEERLIELPSLWERYKAGNSVTGISPVNVNITSYNIRPTVLDNLTSILMDGSSTDKNNYIYEGNRENHNCNRSSMTVSESTAETILTNSPSDAPTHHLNHQAGNGHIKNNTNRNMVPSVNNYNPTITVPLQPHQGRNPCLERNLMIECSDDMSVSGNNLLERSNKNKDFRFLLSNDNVFDSVHFSENIESNLLDSRDLNTSARANYHPIPYVQNAVHGPQVSSVNAMPKQPNLPGNGRHDDPGSTSKAVKEKKGFGFFGFRSYLAKKNKKSKASDSMCDEDQRPLKSGYSTDNSPTAAAAAFVSLPNSFGHSLNYMNVEGSEGSGSKGKSNLRQSDKLNFDSSANRKLSPVVTKVCVVGDSNTREVVVSPNITTNNDFQNTSLSYPDYGIYNHHDNFENNASKAQSQTSTRLEGQGGSNLASQDVAGSNAHPSTDTSTPLSVSVPVPASNLNLSTNQNDSTYITYSTDSNGPLNI